MKRLPSFLGVNFLLATLWRLEAGMRPHDPWGAVMSNPIAWAYDDLRA